MGDESPHVTLCLSNEGLECAVITSAGGERQLGGVRVVLGSGTHTFSIVDDLQRY